jgi:SAM-dependent methyltransferase
VNVGAGAGSYEPRDRHVIAVEPSMEMINKRPPNAAPAYQGSAELLPLRDNSVDAALAVFTIHHWSDVRRGLRELVRVARERIVILTWDTTYAGSFWLTRDYIPEVDDWTVSHLPSLDEIAAELGDFERRSLRIPRDCHDGFLRAFWARPEAYLDDRIRRNISQFNLVDQGSVSRAIEHLDHDLSNGDWDAEYRYLRSQDSEDLGYCILVAEIE